MRASLPVALTAALLLSLPAVCQAQDQNSTAKLASIKITGSAKFTSEQIVAASGLRVGSDISRDDFQRAADQLGKSGCFSNVQYRYGDSDRGVEAEFQVTDAPSVAILFDNFPWFTDDELIADLKSTVPLFDGTAPEGGEVLDDISDELQIEIGKRGFHGTVSHSLITAPENEQHVQLFHVDDSMLTVASLDFGDSLAQTNRDIHLRLSDMVGSKYSRAALTLFEIEQVRPVYLSHGLLRVKFGTPATKVQGTGANASVAINVPIDPGPTFTWRPPTWTGSRVFGMLELSTMIPLHEGDAADGMKIEQGWQNVTDAYAQRGYLDVKLDSTPHFDEVAKTVSYAIAITEGPQFHMGKLVLTGLSIEGEKRIRGAWRIPAGAVFDKSVYEQFVTGGMKEAFSGLPIHYEKVGRFLQEDPQNATVDVLIDFQ